jgi:hypothetical protein
MTTDQPEDSPSVASLVRDSERVLEALRRAGEIARAKREMWRRLNETQMPADRPASSRGEHDEEAV